MFHTILHRVSRVRRLIEDEQQRRPTDRVRLLRLKTIALKLGSRLQSAMAARHTKIASAPRLRPLPAFARSATVHRSGF